MLNCFWQSCGWTPDAACRRSNRVDCQTTACAGLWGKLTRSRFAGVVRIHSTGSGLGLKESMWWERNGVLKWAFC